VIGNGSWVIGQQATVAKPSPNQQIPTLFAQKLKTLTIVFPNRSDSIDLQTKANAVGSFLSKELVILVKAKIGDDTAAVEASRANRADVAFLSSRPALNAEQLAHARLFLAEVRPNYSGRYTYKSIFVVPANSQLKSKDSAKATLEQLRGKTRISHKKIKRGVKDCENVYIAGISAVVNHDSIFNRLYTKTVEI
jgi:phosphonate transport system substrate-binding protein